ncbi:MAG: agmatine deiminase family protein, partial [Oscillospiraceae bacterium]|nr:agmatine deiminase family protein [Oscillospiraceae bacterium]
MTKLHTLPGADGFRMPGEFAQHSGTIMIFPERPGSWHYDAAPALPCFRKIWETIAAEETLWLLTSEKMREKAVSMTADLKNVRILTIPQDDAWARDTAPTFVRNVDGEVRGIDWQFNAWGGNYDGLYADWAQDNALAGTFCEMAGITCYDAQHFVLEGGSIHADGEGTILVTESCLLSKGRNPERTKAEIKQILFD